MPHDDVRTFAPLWVGGPGRFSILGYVRDGGPAAPWLRGLVPGDLVRFAAPARSLRPPAGPLVMIGDETSIAVTASFHRERPGEVRALFELGRDVDATGALATVGLSGASVVRRGDPGTLLVDLAAEAAAGGASIAITGGGELVQRVRAALETRGHGSVTVKAYWVEGKTGLD